MPAAPRVKLPVRTGGGSTGRGPASPANPGSRGQRTPADPILRLAQQQKRQLSDREMQAARQIDSDWQRLVAVPLGVELSRFARRYQQALDALQAQQQQDAADAEDDLSADGGGFGGGAPVSPANPGPRGPDALRRGGVGGANPIVPSTWLLDAHGGDAHGLLRSAKGQITKFAQATQKTVAHAAADASAQGMTDGQALLAIALQPLVGASGGELDPEDFLQAGVAAARKDARFALLSQLMNSGGPLAQLLGSMPQESADQAYRTLLYGLGHGENPQALVTDLQQILNSSRSRALTISRTEMMNAYRGAQLDNYRANSDVVQGWIWLADLGSACPLCTDLNGEIHPLDDDMVSHPRCRCSPAPYTKSWDDILSPVGLSADELGLEDTSLQVESGEDWFARQDEATQRAVLGPSAFNAYSQGDLKLSDLVGRNPDGGYYQKSLKEAGLDYREYLYPAKSVASEAESVAQEAESAVEQEVAQAGASTIEAEAIPAAESESAVEALGSVEEIQAREAEMQGVFDNAQAAAAEAGTSAWEQSLDKLSANLVKNRDFMRLARKWERKVFNFSDSELPKLKPRQIASDAVYKLMNDYHTYAGGSSSASAIQIALQEAAREEFGLTSAAMAYSAEARDAALAAYGEDMPGLQAFLRTMYNTTQQQFADLGITEVQVFRGMTWPDGQQPVSLSYDGSLSDQTFALHSISSFSTSLETAMAYANGSDFGANAGDYGAILAGVIPVDQIMSTGLSGFGAVRMQEITMLGGEYDLLAVAASDPSFTLDDLYTAFSGE